MGRNMPVDCCWEDAMSNASKNEGRALDRPPNEAEPLRCANEAASKLLYLLFWSYFNFNPLH